MMFRIYEETIHHRHVAYELTCSVGCAISRVDQSKKVGQRRRGNLEAKSMVPSAVIIESGEPGHKLGRLKEAES
jgi:hypothetical protein